MQIVQQLEEKTWSSFVEQHPQGNIFHTPEMFHAFAQAKGYHPTLWAVLNEQNTPLALLLPVQITVASRLFGVLSRLAVAYGSVLVTSTPEGEPALQALLQAYNQKAKGEVLYTELRNQTDLQTHQPTLAQHGFVYHDHLNFIGDLREAPEEAWKKIAPAARRNIQKALASGVEISQASHLQEITETYPILQNVYHRLQVPLPHLSLFQAIFTALSPLNRVKVLIARVNHTPIGVLYLLAYQGIAIYWYTGTLREYSTYRPSDLLMWSALQLSRELGCHTFDFGGGGKPNEEYGVRDFKAKFGGTLVNYGRNICVHSPLRFRLSRAAYLLKQKIGKRFPR